MSKVEITYEDLKELLRTAQMRGTEHHWPAIALQFAEEALKEIERLRALLQADEKEEPVAYAIYSDESIIQFAEFEDDAARAARLHDASGVSYVHIVPLYAHGRKGNG